MGHFCDQLNDVKKRLYDTVLNDKRKAHTDAWNTAGRSGPAPSKGRGLTKDDKMTLHRETQQELDELSASFGMEFQSQVNPAFSLDREL